MVENLIVVPPLVRLVPEKVHLVELACLDVLQAVRFVPPVWEDVERDLPANREGQTVPLEEGGDGGKRNEKRKEERKKERTEERGTKRGKKIRRTLEHTYIRVLASASTSITTAHNSTVSRGLI